MLGELWIDRPALVETRLPDIPLPLRSHVEAFITQGFTVFPGLIPKPVTDRILADTRRMQAEPDRFVVASGDGHIDPATIPHLTRGLRMLDLFAISEAARDAIAHPTLVAFLRTIFDDDVIAMQSLYFEYGSEQGIHQDTAYVVSEEPLNLAASWIALEDVGSGSGELVYYPGSHRFDHFLFSDQHKHWRPERDGHDQHRAFLDGLHDQARSRGIAPETFQARRGDVLIWHADLAHGGNPITQPDRTRRSLVAHYCPRSVKPAYRRQIGRAYMELPHGEGAAFTSYYFDLRGTARSGLGKVVNDGGLARAKPLPALQPSLIRRSLARLPAPIRRIAGAMARRLRAR